MGRKNQYLDNLVPHLREKYGTTQAEAIITSARKHFETICEENAGEPAAYDMHTKQRIYPAIASLKAMTEAGIARQEAIDFLCDYYRWRAARTAVSFKKMMKVPGLYRLMPSLWKKMTPKMFGEAAGFKSIWYDDPDWELSFDMVQCPYFDKCSAYGCPELCKAYCEADDICYGNMHPKIIWGRTQTLGKGGDCCDFRMAIKK